jgi:hypothetical protein
MNTKIAPYKTDPNEALIQFLDRYCSTEIAPGYAVMLRGPWGSGKTWFVEKYRERLKAMKKRSLYVTLFGVKRPADISDQFFAQIHTVLGNENVQKGWSIAKSLLKGALKVDLDGDGKEDGSLQISIPDLGKWASTEGAVLIFDDLERVGMPLDDILGYINQFVEHDGYRVIVIANEARAIEKEPGFPTIKEKVIGRSFEIQPNVDDALNRFLEEISNDEARSSIKLRREVVLEVFHRAGYGNLRQLRQAIFDFSDLWICLDAAQFATKNEFVARLLDDVLTLSIEYRAGAISVTDIRNVGETDWDSYFKDNRNTNENVLPPTQAEAAFKRHGFDKQPRLALLPEAYAMFFGNGHLLNDAAAEALLRSPYLANESTPSWRRLWYLTDLSNEDFVRLSDDVYKKFANLEYEDEGEFLHASALLLFFGSERMLQKTSSQIEASLKNVVLQLAANGKLDPGPKGRQSYSSREDMSAFGLGYTNRNSAAFRKFVAFYRAKQMVVRREKIREWAVDWIGTLTTDPAAWAMHLVPGEGDSRWFVDEPVFNCVSPRLFCDGLNALSTPALEKVRSALRGRYESVHAGSKWKLQELPFLKSTKSMLEKQVKWRTCGSATLSTYALKTWFIPDLQAAIGKIEAFELPQKTHSTSAIV